MANTETFDQLFSRRDFYPILTILFIFTSCGGNNNKQKTETNPIKDYPVLTISEHPVTLLTDFPATVQGQQVVEIRPKIDGYIESILVDEGASVKQGQVLFKISAPQYEQEVRTAQANIQIALANVDAAKMEVNKVRPLVEKKIISQYELQSAEFTLEAKQAALAQARATLANAKINLGYTAVTSPVNGVIGTIPYKIGSLVSSNTTQPLTTISNVANIYAYFSVNEKQDLEFSSQVKGATTQERLASLPPVTLVLANGTTLPKKGRIETVAGQINTATGSISVRATFPNPGNLVRSGSSGTVQIPTIFNSAILIPQKSTYEIQGKQFVYSVTDSNTVKSTEIKIRQSSSGQYYVVEAGLRPGDKIVLEGVASLREGLKIKPVKVNNDSLYRALINPPVSP